MEIDGTDLKSKPKEIALHLDTIKWLLNKNKIKYIQSKPPNFNRIDHDYSEDSGLPKWKSALDHYITNCSYPLTDSDELQNIEVYSRLLTVDGYPG